MGRGDRDGTEGVDAADADPVQPRLEAGHLRLGRMEAELELVEAESERRVGDFLAGLQAAVAPVRGQREFHFGNVILSAR